MKILKLVAIGLGSVIGLLVVAGLAVALLFDPNDYKDTVAALAEERTGRSLVIGDDLDLSVFPWLAVETGGIAIGNAPGFEGQDFATIDEVSVRVRLLPLLRRRVEVGTVTLDGLRLNLGRDADGRGNWEDLLAQSAADAAPAETAAGGPGIEQFGVEGIRIRDGAIYWHENVSDVRYVVSGLDFDSSSISPGTPTELRIELDVRDVGSQLSAHLRAAATAEWTANGDFRATGIDVRYAVADAREVTRAEGRLEIDALSGSASGPIDAGAGRLSASLTAPPVGPSDLDVAARWQAARFEPAAGTLGVDTLVTSAGGLEAAWQLDAVALAGTPRFAGSVELTSGTGADAVALLDVALPDGLDPASIGRLELRAGFDATLDPQNVTLTDVAAAALGVNAVGSATLDGTERLTARLQIPAFAPNETLKRLARERVPDGIEIDAIDRLALSAEVDADFAARTTTLSNVRAELLGATLTGNARSTVRDGGTVIDGAIRSTPIAPERVFALAGELLAGDLEPAELGSLSIDTRFRVDTARDTASLDGFAIEAFGLAASGDLSASGLSASPSVTGRAQLRAFDPRGVLRRFGQNVPQSSDPTALSSASIDTRFAIDADGGRFDDLVVVLDDSRISGSFSVADFEAPQYRFDLSADDVDVDRYLPPSADEAEAGERTAGDIELSNDALTGIDIGGSARVGRLGIAGLELANVSTSLAIGGGRASVESARADLYGGRFEGGLGVDTTGDRPTLALTGQAAGVALEPLVTALTGGSVFSGTGNLDLDLKGTGATIAENIATAAGAVSFSLTNGALDGFNLGHSLCKLFNAATSAAAPAANVPDVTEFQLVQGSATVRDGIASSDDLLFRTSYLDNRGGGRVALVEQRLDYEFDAEMTGPIRIQGCQTMDRLIGGSLPWTITGTLDDPVILPDFREYLRQRIEDQLRDRLQDRLRDLL